MPIAIPTSAWASAGASFTPSPIISTAAPVCWSSLTAEILSSGNRLARYSMPSSSATLAATRSLSPVNSTMRLMPSLLSARTASLTPARSTSATATSPTTPLVAATKKTVFPFISSAWAACAWAASSLMLRSLNKRRFPITHSMPSTMPTTPRPESDVNCSTVPCARPRSSAACTIARANGCSLRLSSVLTAWSNASSLMPNGTRSVTCGWPRVRVPVLSTTRVSTRASCSSAIPPLISKPRCAAFPTLASTTTGVANAIAQEQATTSTATAFKICPVTRKVTTAIVRTTGK